MNNVLLDDDGKLRRRWLNKRVNADKEGIEFKLSFAQFCSLVSEAGLVSSQLGFSGEGYVLARYRDAGPYAYGNCRFITQTENMAERSVTPAAAAASRVKISKVNDGLAALPASERRRVQSERVKGSARFQRYSERRKVASEDRARVRSATLHPSYAGSRGSQFGTFWITDGVTNQKWRESNGDLPDGFRRGRAHGADSTKRPG